MAKSLVATLLVALLSLPFLLTSCFYDETEVGIDIDSISMSIVENSITRSGLYTKMSNPNGYEIYRGYEFWLEKQTDDGWKRLPQDGSIGNDIVWTICERPIIFENIGLQYFIVLPNGHYRILVSMGFWGQGFFLRYVEFTITDDTPIR